MENAPVHKWQDYREEVAELIKTVRNIDVPDTLFIFAISSMMSLEELVNSERTISDLISKMRKKAMRVLRNRSNLNSR